MPRHRPRTVSRVAVLTGLCLSLLLPALVHSQTHDAAPFTPSTAKVEMSTGPSTDVHPDRAWLATDQEARLAIEWRAQWAEALAELEHLQRRSRLGGSSPGHAEARTGAAPEAADKDLHRLAMQIEEGLRRLRSVERTREDVWRSPALRAEVERLRALARLGHDSTRSSLGAKDSGGNDAVFPEIGNRTPVGRPRSTLRGRVTDESGAPVARAEVAAYRNGDRGIQFTALTLTDEDGRFVLDGLSPGTLDLEVRSPHLVDLSLGNPLCRALAFGRPSCEDHGGSVDLRAGETVDLELRGGAGVAVTGTVTDESGTPFPVAYVAVRDAGDRQIGGINTDANGVYRIENLLPDQTVFVLAQTPGTMFEIFDDLPCPGWDCRVQNVGQGLELEAGSDAVADFDLGLGGHIRISVLDAGTGDFLPDWPATSVSVYYADGSYACRASQIYEPGPEFLSCALPDGNYLVSAASSSYVSRVYDGIDCVQGCPYESGTPISVVEGQVADITMSLHRGGSISGSVADAATGLPLPERPTVWLFDADGNYLKSAGVSADGSFQIVALQTGSYHLYTTNYTGYFDELWPDIPYRHSAGDPTTGEPIGVVFGEDTGGIDFALDKGLAIRGTLTERSTGAPLSSATVVVYDADRYSRTAYVGSDGSWVMQPLHPGTYKVLSRHSDPSFLEHMWQGIDCPLYGCGLEDATPIELGARGDADGIDLTVIAPARIRGTVRDENGLPVVGTRVGAFHRAGGVGSIAAVTGLDGTYEITGIGAGEYTVVAEHPDHVRRAFGGSGYCSEWECDVESGAAVAVAASSVVSEIDFVLPHGGVVQGRITARVGGHGLRSAGFWLYDAEGMPVEGGFTEDDGTFRVQAVPKDGEYTLSVVWAPAGYIRATWRNTPSTFFPGAAPALQTLAGDRITFPPVARGDIAMATADLVLDVTGDATTFGLENEFLDPEASGTSAAVGVYTCALSCRFGSNPVGAALQLEATPGPGSVFVGWSGDPQCVTGQVTLDDDVTCVATFDVDPDSSPEEIFVDGFETGTTSAWDGP